MNKNTKDKILHFINTFTNNNIIIKISITFFSPI